MNYIITGGTGFIDTHLTNLILEEHPDAKVWNLGIVKPGTPNPAVKKYKPAVKEGEELGSTFVECDVRKPIENLPFTPVNDHFSVRSYKNIMSTFVSSFKTHLIWRQESISKRSCRTTT